MPASYAAGPLLRASDRSCMRDSAMAVDAIAWDPAPFWGPRQVQLEALAWHWGVLPSAKRNTEGHVWRSFTRAAQCQSQPTS